MLVKSFSFALRRASQKANLFVFPLKQVTIELFKYFDPFTTDKDAPNTSEISLHL